MDDQGQVADQEIRLLKLWRERAQKSAEAHYKIAGHRLRWNTLLSSAAVVGSTALGTTVIANVEETLDTRTAWVLGASSALVAIMSAVHRSLALGEHGEKHRAAGAAWDEIFNNLCVRLATVRDHPPTRDDLETIETAMSDLVVRSPTIPQRWFERVSLVRTYSELSEDPGMLRRVPWWRRWRVKRSAAPEQGGVAGETADAEDSPG